MGQAFPESSIGLNNMLLEEIFLLLLPAAVVFCVPMYILFRERMVRRRVETFSRKRVVKLTSVNFFLNIVASFYFLTIFFLIIGRYYNFGFSNLFLTAMLISTICLTFYGNGIYITSIVLEAFTLPQLRFNKQYKTQFIATHLFHGPISHVFIYSGWIFVLLIVSLIDLTNLPIVSSANWQLMLAAGGLLGIFYAIAQIYNGTVPYQFITGVFSLVVFTIMALLLDVNVTNYGISSYFIGFITSFLITLTCYFVFQTTKGENVDWDRSGY